MNILSKILFFLFLLQCNVSNFLWCQNNCQTELNNLRKSKNNLILSKKAGIEALISLKKLKEQIGGGDIENSIKAREHANRKTDEALKAVNAAIIKKINECNEQNNPPGNRNPENFNNPDYFGDNPSDPNENPFNPNNPVDNSYNPNSPVDNSYKPTTPVNNYYDSPIKQHDNSQSTELPEDLSEWINNDNNQYVNPEQINEQPDIDNLQNSEQEINSPLIENPQNQSNENPEDETENPLQNGNQPNTNNTEAANDSNVDPENPMLGTKPVIYTNSDEGYGNVRPPNEGEPWYGGLNDNKKNALDFSNKWDNTQDYGSLSGNLNDDDISNSTDSRNKFSLWDKAKDVARDVKDEVVSFFEEPLGRTYEVAKELFNFKDYTTNLYPDVLNNINDVIPKIGTDAAQENVNKNNEIINGHQNNLNTTTKNLLDLY